LASPLTGRLRANMTSSTKPEVHNVLRCRQRRTEPRPHITGIENFVKFRRVVFRRPLARRFALCYRTVIRPVLSCRSCLSVTLVYCGQTVGWIKMALAMEVGLGLGTTGHIALDGNPAPIPKKGTEPQFLAHFYCGQTAVCIRLPLGAEVGFSLGYIVLDGDPAHPPLKGTAPNFRPTSVVSKRLEGLRCRLVWR